MLLQKRLAAEILKCSPERVVFTEEGLPKINEAITRFDIKKLVNQGYIIRKNVIGTARARANTTQKQRSKGRRRGKGSRKGSRNARSNKKSEWVAKVRVQRDLLRRLLVRSYIDKKLYKNLYKKVKGGYFRSERHIKIYLGEQNLLKKP